MPDRLSTRATLVGLLVAAFLAVQLVVPVTAQFGPRPARFAWHMYSALPEVPRALTVSADGTEQPVDLASLFAVQRAEIDYAAVLRAGVCDATGAAAVKIQVTDAAQPELIECH